MLGRARIWPSSQEKIVLLIAIVLFVCFRCSSMGFLVRTISSRSCAASPPGHSRRWDGDCCHRARGRSDDRRDLRDVCGLDAPPRRYRRLDPGRYAARLSAGAVGRRDQWRADRLCRDPRVVRDFGHGVVRLRLRSLRSRPPLRRLYARQRRRIAWIGGGFVSGVPTPILFFAPRRPARLRVPALHQAGPVHLRDRRQFRSGAHFAARLFARSSSCNTRFRRRSPMSPA